MDVCISFEDHDRLLVIFRQLMLLYCHLRTNYFDSLVYKWSR